MRPPWPAAALAAAALHHPSAAASFDCATATQPRDRLICANPTLSDLDTRLGRLYTQRAARLSAPGATRLRNSQRSWLHYAATVCPLKIPAGTDIFRNPETCLANRYHERLDQLAQVGLRAGPFTFTRIDEFAASVDDDGTGSTMGFATRHVAYPQIDNPLTPSARSWNSKMVRPLPQTDDCGEGGDGELDYALGLASETLISVRWADDLYCHGAAHGVGGWKVQTIVLTPAPHPFGSRDLFRTDAAWTQPLQKLFRVALHKSDWTPPPDDPGSVLSAIDQEVVDPSNWFLTQEGITVAFGAYEVGCYACSPPPITVPWTSLGPYVTQHAPVP